MYNPVVYTKLQAVKDSDNLKFIELFLHQVECYPNHPAVITSERTISYAELADQAKSLAAHLLHLGVRNEMPVAILLKSGIEQVICQVAILLAGGTCVPLNITSPDDRLSFMLQTAGVTYTITEFALTDRALSTRYVLVDSYPLNDSFSIDFPGQKLDSNHRGYIMFTSGTTGQPKPVELEFSGILRLVINADYLPVSTSDRVANISPPDFDAILLEFWGALLNGAAIVVIDREDLLNPETLKSRFIGHDVSAILITPSLFNFIISLCPDAFSTLSYLMVAGEIFNINSLRALPPEAWPKNIYNAYGPTENTTYTLYYPISLDDLTAKSIPLGHPINNTDVFILDKELQLVEVGVLGEIYVGGDGVARGYLNRPDLTAEKFITTQISGKKEPQRLYKTGDLGWQREDGIFMFGGRIDNQIKLQGYRIEAEEVEVQLLNTGLLHEAAVCAIKKEGGDDGYLLAFVVPQDPDNFSDKQLLNKLQQYLPPYMLPRIHLVDSIPLNANGKADKHKLIKLFQ